MFSLPFSVGTHIPKILTTPNPKLLTTKHVEKTVIKFSNKKQKTISPIEQLNEDPKVLLKRREAVGFGLRFGLVDVLLQLLPQPNSSEAVEAAAAPCELTVSPSGLAFCDKVVGKGPEAVKGQLIKAHYVGRLENGKVFDSSYNRGKPLTFRIGVGEVIKGWDQGILGGDGVPPMLAGGKRTLRLPPELGYGVRGAGCKGGKQLQCSSSSAFFELHRLRSIDFTFLLVDL
ncbi:peptidyl-prolyl cis-trans isomerase FKBP13, chloroplastic isoform X1 [Durio zibethinus]|uniref:peptidylprolyl isomerase n=1 Tax=Durio zibethinus TaxID=66656 RepID=A0A6P6AIF5_DURZI|nr:peptidyl-prolyl cis-trans isomerase FKBP13, chloroplastic isoform X1 [Durio zibethinus]